MKKAPGTGPLDETLPGGAGPVGGPSASSMHAALRLATSPDHQRVDRAISRFDLGCAQGYAAFLSLNTAALESLRPHWRDLDTAEFDGLLGALAADLASFGATRLAASAVPGGPINGLGLAYVVRGARLGARILRQRVPAGFPAAYLDFAPSLSWPGFLQQLNGGSEGPPGRRDDVVRGARDTFAVYDRLARLGGAAA